MVVEVHKKTIVQLKSVQLLHFQGCAEQPQGQTCREMSCCSVLLGREIILSVDAGGIQPVAPGDGGRCWGTSRALWTQLLGTAAHSSQQQAGRQHNLIFPGAPWPQPGCPALPEPACQLQGRQSKQHQHSTSLHVPTLVSQLWLPSS